MTIQDVSEKEVNLIFRPLPPHFQPQKTALPILALQKLIPVRLLQTGLAHFEVEEPQQPSFIVKLHSRVVATINVDPLQSFSPILALLRHSFYINEFGLTPALVSRGKRCGDDCTFQDLLEDRKVRDPQARNYIVAHVVLPLIGGGLPDLGAKNAQRQLLQSKVAGLLLEVGIPPVQIASVTTKLINQAGWAKLNHLCYVESMQSKHESLMLLCSDAGIMLPKPSPILQKVEGRLKKQAKTNILDEDFEVDTYLLQDGFFLNEDNTKASILSSFQPGSSGVILSNIKQAEPWLSTQQPISTDELAMMVTGLQTPTTAMPWQLVQAPAHNAAGKAVLLQGALIQFGARNIKLPPSTDKEMNVEPVPVCAVSVYKEDYDLKTWEALVKSPVKTVKALLALHGFANMIGRPWGRSFKDQHGPSTPQEATSIHFHAECANDRFDQFLARSGFLKVYVIPKDESGKPKDVYRIVWHSGTPQAIDAMTAGVAGVAGLVRNKKGYGLRCQREAFDGLWKILHPDQDPPIEHKHTKQYRVQPFPNGTTKEAIQAWGVDIHWPVRAIRTSGAKQWILGADHEPPGILLWNGHPLIAHEMPKIKYNSPIIVAGPNARKVSRQPPLADSMEHNAMKMGEAEADPFRFSDPWMVWRKNNQSEVAQSPITNSAPRGSNSFPPKSTNEEHAPRAPTGPVASQFSLQDQRLNALETAVKQLKTDQDSQAKHTAEQIQHLDQKVATYQKDTHQTLQQIVSDNRELKMAIGKQDEKFLGAFAELKQMFYTHGTKRSRPTPFQDHDPEEEFLHDMEQEELM